MAGAVLSKVHRLIQLIGTTMLADTVIIFMSLVRSWRHRKFKRQGGFPVTREGSRAMISLFLPHRANPRTKQGADRY